MPSEIVKTNSKGNFKVGDVVRLTSGSDRMYVICTGIKEKKFSGAVLHDEVKRYDVGHHSDEWVVDSFEKVSVTINFT